MDQLALFRWFDCVSDQELDQLRDRFRRRVEFYEQDGYGDAACDALYAYTCCWLEAERRRGAWQPPYGEASK